MKKSLHLLSALALSTSLTPLSGANAEIEEIIITATPIERTTDDLARSVATMGGEEIARQSAQTLGELLEDLPGVTSSSFARGASRPIIRGLDTFRVRVLENGSGSHDVSALSEDHGIPIDPLAAQRIEIIRGPAVLRYGSAAIGGAVSVLNNRIPEAHVGDPQGQAIMARGFNDDSTEIGILLDGSAGPLALHADLFTRDSEDYEIPDDHESVQENTATSSNGFALGGSAILDRGFIGLSWSYFESDYGIPGGHGHGHGGGGDHEDLVIEMEQDKVQLRSELSGDGFVHRVSTEATWSDYTHDEIHEEDGDIGSTFDNEEGEARIELLHGKGEQLEGAFGIQFRTRTLSAFGEGGELLSPSDMTSWAAFLFEAYQLTDQTALEFGARVERTELEGVGVNLPTFEGVTTGNDILFYGDNESRTFTPVSASVGLVHKFDLSQLNSLTFGATLQYVERAPDILELFAHGPHEATGTFEIGLLDAKKEKGTSFELALRRVRAEGRRLTFDASWYLTNFSDFLYKEETGFVCGEEFDTCGVDGDPGVEDELHQIAWNQDDVRYQGAEAQINYEAMAWSGGALTIGGRFDFVKAEFDDGGNLPRVPPRRWGGSALIEHGAFRGEAKLLRVDEQREVGDDEEPTSGYLDLGLQASWTFERDDNRHVEIGISGHNMLDEEQRNHVSFKKEDVMMPGRSVRLYARAVF